MVTVMKGYNQCICNDHCTALSESIKCLNAKVKFPMILYHTILKLIFLPVSGTLGVPPSSPAVEFTSAPLPPQIPSYTSEICFDIYLQKDQLAKL